MVSDLAHFISKLLAQWVAAGRKNSPIPSANGTEYFLFYGFRYQVQILIVCLIFTVFLTRLGLAELPQKKAAFRSVIFILSVLALATILSYSLAIAVYTTRIKLTQEGIVFRRFGIDSWILSWQEVTSVSRSPISSSIVFETLHGRKLKISTELNGLQAFVFYWQLLAENSLDQSFIAWMMSLFPPGSIPDSDKLLVARNIDGDQLPFESKDLPRE